MIRRNHFVCFLVFWQVVMWMDSLILADDHRNRDLVGTFIKAKSSAHMWEVNQELFAAAPMRRLKDLKTHKHDGIALRAAWEVLRRTIKESPDKDDDADTVVRLDQRSVQRFIGFVEGRLKISLPRQFEKTLQHAQATEADNILFFPLLGFPIKHWPNHKTPSGLVTNKDIWAVNRKDEAQLLVSSYKKTCKVPMRYRNEAAKKGIDYGLTSIIEDNQCIVGFMGDSCFSYRLLCLNLKSSELLWSTEVWASGLGGFSGQDRHLAVMKVHENKLYVFGACTRNMYIEAFDMKDGSNLFRFGTGY